jgi:hypothetical protein
MSDTVQASGSQLTVIGTEHTLVDIAVAGVFQLVVNATPNVAGDTLELRAYQKVASGDAAPLLAYTGRVEDVPPEPVLVSLPISNSLTVAAAVRFTLKMPAGAPRTFDWRVDRIA